MTTETASYLQNLLVASLKDLLDNTRDAIWYMDRGVAQPGSAPASGAGGRKFKSSRPDFQSYGGEYGDGVT